MVKTKIKRRKRHGKLDVDDYIDPDWAKDAAYLYNTCRTIIVENGWTLYEPHPGISGWVHPDHAGSHTISAAFGQWRLDVEQKKRRLHGGARYVCLTDPDDGREGEVRLGGKEGDDGWTGGQLIFRWTQRENGGGQPPERITRMVKLANKVETTWHR